MKKAIFPVIITIILLNTAFAQTKYNMKIKQGNGSAYTPPSSVDEITFHEVSTFTCGDVILYGGETYPTVQIGTQCWFQKNLNIGTRVNYSPEWGWVNNFTIEKFCYNDLPANCITYGGLYNFQEAMQYDFTPHSRVRGICPEGWHIPSKSEVLSLIFFMDQDSNTLKAVGEGTGEGAGTNTSGFSALLAGCIQGFEFGSEVGYYTNFWCSYDGSVLIDILGLEYDTGYVIRGSVDATGQGLSVRCVKD
jgi:uncharacterized protein (TIGR02145 family)